MKLVRVPLRISFVGGGSDLPSHYEKHEGAVVSVTINKYIYITTKPSTALFPHKFRLVYSQVEECNTRHEIKHPIIQQLCFDYNVQSLDLDVMSDVPAGTGLGSSSAFTVGLHKAFSYGEVDKHPLAAQACYTELEDLKEPIGKQDQYAAAFGGLNLFEFSKEGVTVNPISLPRPELIRLLRSMHLVHIGGSRSASSLLKEQAGQDNTEALREMAGQAYRMREYLRVGAFRAMGQILREGWELKKSLSSNMSTPHIDAIIDTAIKHGAEGGKLLGAGGTGFVLLFCLPENRDTMRKGLDRMNLNYVPFEFDMEGAKTLYED